MRQCTVFVGSYIVRPDRVDDIQAQVIARYVAKQTEEELTYPG